MRLAIVLGCFLCLLPSSASGQQSDFVGTWYGKMTTANGFPVDLEYEIRVVRDSLHIVSRTHGQDFDLGLLEVRGDTLTFWSTKAAGIKCMLARTEDRAYAGSCGDGKNPPVTLQLKSAKPPADASLMTSHLRRAALVSRMWSSAPQF